jgi:hypothetical protein
MIKVQVDNENKLVFAWMTKQDKDSEEFINLKESTKSKKYKLVISGLEDVEAGLEKLVLENALKHNVVPTWEPKLQ